MYLWDDRGQRYLDFSGSAAVNFIGHGVQEIPDAMAAQARHLEFVHSSQFTTPVAEEYAQDLLNFAGDNFQVFYRQQAANYILPQTTYYAPGVVQDLGCPEAGLTNAQAWQKYGIAFAGSIAPADATTRSNIIGLIKSI